ncbi:MAG: alanine--glyoxylate aminotransferase family protein [Chloroflexota bacterium]
MTNLRTPGPTPLPPEILQAQAQPMVDHRGPEFQACLQTVTANLKTLFQTRNDMIVLTGSGTGGMEAVVVNTLSPGDKVLVVSIGAFGDRFVSIIKAFGGDVVPLAVEWGKAADPDAIRKALDANPAVKAVFITHNETSTGVTNPMRDIAPVVKGFGKLLVVDGISGLGSLDLPVDELKIDVAVAGSQKGWMASPGVSMVSVSPTGWEAIAKAKMPRFYWDFTRAKDIAARGQTPWTPAVSVFFGMDVGLKMLLKEGLANIFARHARIGKATRDGVKSLGLALVADERFASNTVTAVVGPIGVDIAKLRKLLREKHDVVVAGGQGKLEGKIFRIGHMGLVSLADIKEVIDSLADVLPEAGFVKAK